MLREPRPAFRESSASSETGAGLRDRGLGLCGFARLAVAVHGESRVRSHDCGPGWGDERARRLSRSPSLGRERAHTGGGARACAGGNTRGARSDEGGLLRGRNKSSKQRLSLSGSWQQGHSNHVQHPVPYSSRLQGIHRGGKGTCDRARLKEIYPCSWLSPPGRKPSFRHGF